MPKKPAPIPSPFVAKIYAIDAQIEKLKEDRKKLCADLIKLGEGSYSGGEEEFATVVVPKGVSVSFDLYHDAAKEAFMEANKAEKMDAALRKGFLNARKGEAEELCGAQFPLLFDRTVLFSPTKGFEDIAGKVLTPAKARDIIALCKVAKAPGAAYVKTK